MIEQPGRKATTCWVTINKDPQRTHTHTHTQVTLSPGNTGKTRDPPFSPLEVGVQHVLLVWWGWESQRAKEREEERRRRARIEQIIVKLLEHRGGGRGWKVSEYILTEMRFLCDDWATGSHTQQQGLFMDLFLVQSFLCSGDCSSTDRESSVLGLGPYFEAPTH